MRQQQYYDLCWSQFMNSGTRGGAWSWSWSKAPRTGALLSADQRRDVQRRDALHEPDLLVHRDCAAGAGCEVRILNQPSSYEVRAKVSVLSALREPSNLLVTTASWRNCHQNAIVTSATLTIEVTRTLVTIILQLLAHSMHARVVRGSYTRRTVAVFVHIRASAKKFLHFGVKMPLDCLVERAAGVRPASRERR